MENILVTHILMWNILVVMVVMRVILVGGILVW